MGGSKKVDPNALISDRLKSMNEALVAGGALPEIDENDFGDGKCVVEFEKSSTAVMEDQGTFNIKLLRLGDTSKAVRFIR